MCVDLCVEIQTLMCLQPLDTCGHYKRRKTLLASDGSGHMYQDLLHISLHMQITLWKMIEKS